MTPHRCPVCAGTGHVAPGFYLHTAGYLYSTSSVSPESCRACGGSGVLWEPEPGRLTIDLEKFDFTTVIAYGEPEATS